MNFDRKTSTYHWQLAVILLIVPLASAQPQTSTPVSNAASSQTQIIATKEEKGDDMEELRSQVKQLRSLVDQQQRALSEIQKRLDETDGKIRVASQVSPTSAGATVSVSPDL